MSKREKRYLILSSIPLQRKDRITSIRGPITNMYIPDRIDDTKLGEVRIVFPPPRILSRCSTPFEAGRTSLIIRNNYTTRVENVGASGGRGRARESRSPWIAVGHEAGRQGVQLQLRQSWVQLQGDAVSRAHTSAGAHGGAWPGLKRV